MIDPFQAFWITMLINAASEVLFDSVATAEALVATRAMVFEICEDRSLRIGLV